LNDAPNGETIDGRFGGAGGAFGSGRFSTSWLNSPATKSDEEDENQSVAQPGADNAAPKAKAIRFNLRANVCIGRLLRRIKNNDGRSKKNKRLVVLKVSTVTNCAFSYFEKNAQKNFIFVASQPICERFGEKRGAKKVGEEGKRRRTEEKKSFDGETNAAMKKK
jgi:hypothetical protein